MGNPTSWWILRQDALHSSVMEEAVFTIQGVLVSKDLPPILEKPRMAANRFRYLRQGITLTGFGTPTFSNALDAAQLLYDCFNCQFPEGTLDEWSSSQANVANMECIDISNQYLTLQKDAQGQKNMPFLKGVDPWDILGDGSCTYVHTEDNQVHFFTAYRDGNRDRKFQPCEPQIFRLGDIIQAQLSFVVISIKGGKHKMLMILHLLVLLESKFTKVCEQSTAYLTFTSESAQVTKLKFLKIDPLDSGMLMLKHKISAVYCCIASSWNLAGSAFWR
ncbi:hypothetical protein L208DRAFT_1253333 [Tricholoma matsutake]|nr:hypothetical protein L208DRAFT_1253333 [Tricholoma matsutake 945]